LEKVVSDVNSRLDTLERWKNTIIDEETAVFMKKEWPKIYKKLDKEAKQYEKKHGKNWLNKWEEDQDKNGGKKK
jgi:hypothetical protein